MTSRTEIEGRMQRATSDPRWSALVRRDRSADGRFFYSVSTTGVYCRPSCAARLARPEHVEFHTTAAEAERAGFRPCKRCKPNESSLAERQAAQITAACRLLESKELVPSLAELASHVGLSRHHFHRLFKQGTGLTPRQYAEAHRQKRVRSALAQGSSVTEAIFGAGYGSSGRFYETSKATLGMTPRVYRDGGANTEIRFAVGESSLGSILVAQSERGVCAILLGDDPEELTRELQDRFPRAHLIGADRDFEELVARVVAFVETPALGLDLPLDVRGTAFQQRVWRALCEIPAGTTISYTELAQRIGASHAVRAVAGACAANPLAVAIPCHRVVRSDGHLAGYRWGLERKRALLEKERSS